MANAAGVDLVEIAPNANPPVVKLIDWGKFQYQQMKEQSKAKKRAKSSEVKQIRLGLKISDNDLSIKLRKVREFIDDGDRVKITIVFRGREMAHQEIGDKLARRVVEMTSEYAILEQQPQMAGRNLSFSIRRK
jgi:translation initiation factor IF-3